jgi:asparagine synthase (glutamine-hydrolysing)
VRSGLGALSPGRVRAGHVRKRLHAATFTWLRPAARDELGQALGRAEAVQPLTFAASVRMVPRRRTQYFLARNRRVLARPYDVDVSSPFLNPAVVHALAHDGGVLGRGDRTTVLRAMIADLLPDEVLARSTKASFGGAYMAGPTRAFAEQWSGEGLDGELVDVAELRRLWQTGANLAPTAALLQAAWLADRRNRSTHSREFD